MSKSEILLDIVSGLRSLATSLEGAAATMLVNSEIETTKKEPPAMPTSATNGVTLEQVRSCLADKSLAGFTDEVRGLLEKHGAQKLSQIDPINYMELLADAEALI